MVISCRLKLFWLNDFLPIAIQYEERIAVLAEEGIVIAEQGRGTFVRSAKRLSYPIGKRTRFSEGLARRPVHWAASLLEHRLENARLLWPRH
jgi:hypothetical protein